MDDTKQVVLTIEALQTALGLGRVRPSALSPLSALEVRHVTGAARQDALQLLREVGWLTSQEPGALTATAQRALKAVADPQIVAGVLVGSPYAIGTTTSYSDTGWAPGALVSFDMDVTADRAVVVYPQSPQHLIDLVLKQVAPTPAPDGLAFGIRMEPNTFVALLCVLDWQMHSQLRARLEREPLPTIRVRVKDLWRMLVEARGAVDLSWMVGAVAHLMPMLDFALDDAQIEEATRRIAEMGWLQPAEKGSYSVVGELEELGNAVLPPISLAALNIARRLASGEWRQTHLAMVQGVAALLLLQPVLDGGRQMVTVDSVTPDELRSVLSELATDVERPAPAASALRCEHCQAELLPVDRFCRLCGHAVRSEKAPPTPPPLPVCARCGSQLPAGARFCTRCGAAFGDTRAPGR